MAPQRHVPKFAAKTFRSRFRRRGQQNVGRPSVILWPDTWNNHFHPSTLEAAVQVLEAAGFHVTLPARSLCCGRPLYDYGMLGLARRVLTQTMDTLGEALRAGTSIVGLEPSCVSVFRDELPNLFPGDDLAKRLHDQSYLLSEFLVAKAPNFRVPSMPRSALVHGHCHQKAVLRFNDDVTLLQQVGLEHKVLDSGCCGMAGAFGFERGDHYDVSMQCGERVLLPAVRAAPVETLIVSNGFSCREQISQTTDREAVHIAQVLKMALDSAPH
jgi:Fe-S oxidoreductase